MNYEEKYKKALERAKKLYEQGTITESLGYVFPELKESEEEKIKKTIIRILKGEIGYTSKEDVDKYVTWLEKQGNKSINIDVESMVSSYEQRLESQGGTKYTPLVDMRLTAFRHGVENVLDELNLKKLEKQDENKHTDKVEPKFKVGDWVLNNVCYPLQIASIKDSMYILTEGDALSVSFVDEHLHLWSIQDAEDGDVLVDEDNNIGLYLEEKDNVYWHSCIYLGCDNCLRGFSIGGYHKHKNTKPATKEQRDLLFQKMKEAGYEWDSEKKELKKIEPKKVNANKVINWVNPDKVIEWLKGRIKETKEYFGEHGVYYDTHLTLPHNSIEDLINDFKEDFGL